MVPQVAKGKNEPIKNSFVDVLPALFDVHINTVKTAKVLLKSWTLRTNFLALVLAFVLLSASVDAGKVAYANEWAVEITGGNEEADLLANELGFVNKGKIFPDENFFLFRHHSISKRSLSPSDEHHEKLIGHHKVLWAEQQRIRRRVKRSISFDPDQGPADPLWSKTWYLLPTTTPNMKVTDAWEEGYTGKGVVVTILDDGIEYTHPDLSKNYDKGASYDINDNDHDPIPRQTYNNENRHGTRCAGEVAAVANNKFCSVGIAFNAFIGGVRMLDGSVTDTVEAKSIGLEPGHIDIYSASWGPDDDGKTVDGPAKLAKLAFQRGVKTGRGGKGSIFVWASGNGGRKEDNCNCDGYTNSIYTLSISSTTQHTDKPWYSEACSSTLAATYSSGTSSEKQIVTTDLSGLCTQSHTGTSASAPLAAGICALALEANGNLTWRDMQHLVVRTANPTGLEATDWVRNAVGRNVSHSYGYGLMDAYAMVKQAKDWVHVPQQRICKITVVKASGKHTFSSTNPLQLPSEITTCDDGSLMPDLLEHVQARLSISCNRRGEMAIYLTSPMGTTSTLLDRRRLDYSSRGFDDWPFMTTHSWDENPRGTWMLEVRNTGSTDSIGTLTSYVLVLYGTSAADWPMGGLQHTTNHLGTTTSTTSTTSTTKKATKKTTMRATTSKSTANNPEGAGTTVSSTQTTGPENCKTPLQSGLKCLVCNNGFVRSPDKSNCMERCPDGYFPSLERVHEVAPGVRDLPGQDENDWEVEQVVRFEEEERFDGSHICMPCSAGPYCRSCDGPWVRDCTSCIEGFDVVDGGCVRGTLPQSKKIYSLTVAVCILSVVLFVLLFLFLQCRRNSSTGCLPGGRSKPLYKYIPNERDMDDPFEDDPSYDFRNGTYKKNGLVNGSHKTNTFRYKNGSLAKSGSNGHETRRQLLDESDNENVLLPRPNGT